MAELPQKHRVSVSGVLKILGVSRSGYRAWKQRVPSVSEKHRDHIKDAIKQIYDGSHQNYGAPKITEMLHRQGESIAEKTVGNYMRQMGIKAQWVKPYTVTTIDSDFSSELQNILDEQFNPSRPDAVWVSDITYIWTYNGFVYLTSIMDLYSRKIIAWVLSQSLEAIHVVECVNKAKQMRNVTSPLVFHSDRGIQFVSQAFQKVTEGMINSYSKKAYPWDNACIESFHSRSPKYVIAVAAHIGNNVEITTDGFNAVEPKNYLQVQGYNIETKQEKFELTITADSVDSTDERFTMDNLKTTPTIWSNDEGGQMVALLKLGENEHNICII